MQFAEVRSPFAIFEGDTYVLPNILPKIRSFVGEQVIHFT
jgi:hypothetical protein